jgi:acyl-homoserine lactone acylase PvdQ
VASGPVLFAHPLGIGAASSRRFNIGPLQEPAAPAPVFRVGAGSTDWDHWTAMNAPGQSESPDSAHFSDLAKQWSEGRAIPLVFSDRAVESAAETTLLLTPRRPRS